MNEYTPQLGDLVDADYTDGRHDEAHPLKLRGIVVHVGELGTSVVGLDAASERAQTSQSTLPVALIARAGTREANLWLRDAIALRQLDEARAIRLLSALIPDPDETREPGDLVCAECGTRDAQTYVVTTINGDRTEVCRDCDTALYTPTPLRFEDVTNQLIMREHIGTIKADDGTKIELTQGMLRQHFFLEVDDRREAFAMRQVFDVWVPQFLQRAGEAS